jgi:hypothetical protein
LFSRFPDFLYAKYTFGIKTGAENYRCFRQDRAALVKLHRQILLAIDRLERTLLLPPPHPAASV